MIKTKIFSSNSPKKLEDEINLWLEATSWIKIIQITQSSIQDQTIVSIWYDEPNVPILQK